MTSAPGSIRSRIVRHPVASTVAGYGRARAASSCSWVDGRRARSHRRHPRAAAERPRARHVLGDVERALLLQVVAGPPPAAAQRGRMGAGRPGRERGCGRRRRRHRRRHPHREPQPPIGHRALPGRGDRRRRHPSRHLHHGRPPDRPHGPAALRSPRRSAQPLGGGGRGLRHLRLRQRRRCPDGRRRGGVRRHLRGQPAGQRAVPRDHARRPVGARPGERPRQPGRAARINHRSRRDRGRLRAGLRRLRRRRGRRRQAAQRAGRRPVRGEAAHRGLPGPPGRRPGRGHPGSRRRRSVLRDERDGQPRWRRDGRRRVRGRASASRAWSRSRS